MRYVRKVTSLLKLFYEPLRRNGLFFSFMLLTTFTVSVLELPDDERVSGTPLGWDESFLEVYLLCVVLALLPLRVRRWVSGVLAFMVYAVSIADVFCFQKFHSVLNPTMLLLVGETDSREASEFLTSYLTPDLIFSGVGLILLYAILHLVFGLLWHRRQHFPVSIRVTLNDAVATCKRLQTPFGFLVLALLAVCISTSAHNYAKMRLLFGLDSIGEIEHELTNKDCAQFYQPCSRLAFSIFSNELAAQQVDKLIAAKDKAGVDSCSFTSPNIVLIIGESYGKHHSQQYGYFMPTTPRQIRLQKTGLLTPFTDVVSPWNLTSYVFKNVFSLHVVGEKGEWCDYPLFPELFRKAGYHVTFATNQFLPKAKEAVYDFSGGFFLNHPELSASMFDTRNDRLFRYDAGLVKDYYDHLSKQNKEHNLIIFHLIGQHVGYIQRCPPDRRRFTADDYADKRPELDGRKRRILADYDNATLYNDSIVADIVRRFSTQNAIVIYMPDHGEECYEGNRGFFCRNHSAKIDYDLARYEFEIPFWIYCSPKYVASHREIFREIKAARRRPFMTDALPHLLLYLAGIHTPYYHSQYNILSPDYDAKRPRLLKNTTDYNQLIKEHHAKKLAH